MRHTTAGQDELNAEFTASATLAGMIDKLNIPAVAPTGAQKLADKFRSLQAVIDADWLELTPGLSA